MLGEFVFDAAPDDLELADAESDALECDCDEVLSANGPSEPDP